MRKTSAPSNRRRNAPRVSFRSAFGSAKTAWRVAFGQERERLAKRLARYRSKYHVVGRVLAIAAVLAAIAAIGVLADRYAHTSPLFATTRIEVKGLSRLTREEVLHQAGLALGRNIFAVPPREAEIKLTEHAWIASAAVQRRLPGRYLIDVRERNAAALLVMGDILLVARDGTVFKKVSDGDPYDLPLITGLDQEPYTADRALRVSSILSAVALLGQYAEAGLSRSEPISEIHMEPDQNISLYIGEDATHVRLGAAPYQVKLHKLRQVLATLQKKKSRAAYVYLDNTQHSGRVTVRTR
jgi:cell division protein FtsQ